MRKILPLLVVSFLVLSGLGAGATPKENVESEKLTVTFNQPIIRSEEQFMQIGHRRATAIFRYSLPDTWRETRFFVIGTKPIVAV